MKRSRQAPRGVYSQISSYSSEAAREKPIMILPQVHLQKPCYDFYFLEMLQFGRLPATKAVLSAKATVRGPH